MEMKRLNFVKNGVVRLPPGFRFHPTDEELVVQYLKRKVLSLPLPASIIPEFDLQKADPWDLPGDPEKERYFFSKREAKYRNGNRSNRATASGYWKATGIDKQVVTPTTSPQVAGMKKTLVFYRGKPPNASRTDWVMHEYYLHSPHTIDSWVLCRIFMKKRGRKRHGGDEDGARKPKMIEPIFYEFMAEDKVIRDLNLAPSSSTSSCSTGITQVSVHDHEETCSSSSSSCKRFACFTRKPN